ncbi:hypothetical protein [Flavobacterium sp. 245]|uniref:hypothetical protein n=1 Tax=Flavobacterium sp. 245 TaxID=2512115 RepID=UPI0010622359|nr:hypothetical protein [Flavobacterium sp. 245]
MKYALNKEIFSKKYKVHSCCKSTQSTNKKHNCDREKCGDSKCVCLSSYLVFLFFNEINSSSTSKEISPIKQKFPVYQTTLLSGYQSLWFIPKVG